MYCTLRVPTRVPYGVTGQACESWAAEPPSDYHEVPPEAAYPGVFGDAMLQLNLKWNPIDWGKLNMASQLENVGLVDDNLYAMGGGLLQRFLRRFL